MDPVHFGTSEEQDEEVSVRCHQEEGEDRLLSSAHATIVHQDRGLPLVNDKNAELTRNEMTAGRIYDVFSAASDESERNQTVSVDGAGEHGNRVQIPTENITPRTGKTVNVYNVTGNTGVKIVQTRTEGNQKTSSTNINIIDQSKLRLISDFNSRLFIKTIAIKECEKKLLQRGMVTITGRSGEGKTLASLYLLKTLSEKESRQPMILTDPSEWDHIPTHQQSRKPSKYIVLIDDVFGRSNHIQSLHTQWEQKLPMMMPLIEAGVVLLVMTFRTNIFLMCKSQLRQNELFLHCPIVELFSTGDDNEEERRAIFDSHMSIFAKGLRLTEQEKIRITKSKQVLGFPQCCYLFSTHKEMHSKGSLFFTKPVFYLSECLESMSERDSLSYLVLLLVFFYNGNLHQSVLDQFERSSKDKQILEDLIQICVTNCGFTPTLRDISSKAYSLCESYLTCKSDEETFAFLHHSISDTIFLQFCKRYLSKGIQMCSRQTLLEYIRTEESPDDDWIVVVPENKFRVLADRLTKELLSDDCSLILTHFAFKHTKFRKYLFRAHWDDKTKIRLVLLETAMHRVQDELYLWNNMLALLEDNNFFFENNINMLESRVIVTFESSSLLTLSVLRDSTSLAMGFLSTAREVLSSDSFADIMNKLLACSFYKGDINLFSQLIEEGIVVSRECFLAVCMSSEVDTSLFDIAYDAMEGCQCEIGLLKDMLQFSIERRNFYPFEKLAKLIAPREDGRKILHEACIQILLMSHTATPRWFQIRTGHKDQKFRFSDAVRVLHGLGADCSSDECVLLASGGDDVSVLESVLGCGGNIKCKTKSRQNPLHYAALYGSVDTVQLLIKNMKPFEDINGLTPFHFAAKSSFQSLQKLQFLSLWGSNMSYRTKEGHSALILAIQAGNIESVGFLAPIYERTDTEFPLHVAMKELAKSFDGKLSSEFPNLFRNSRIGLIDILLSNGHSLKDKDNLKKTPMYHLLQADHIQLLNYFMEKEDCSDILPSLLHQSIANFQFDIVKHLLQKCTCLMDENGHGPLAKIVYEIGELDKRNPAAEGKDRGQKILDYILENTADVNTANNDSLTPLHVIAMYNKSEIALRLIQKGAAVNAADNLGNTPLIVASSCGHEHMVKCLIDNGGNIHSKNKLGDTGLHKATISDQFNMVKFLTKLGADINITNDKGETCLLKAAKSWSATQDTQDRATVPEQGPRVKIASFLFNQGIELKFSDRDGELFLHSAAENGLTNIVIALIEKGVNVNNTDKRERIPLHKAAQMGHVEIVKCLVDNGAHFEAYDTDHVRPLHNAAERGHTEIVKYLVEIGANLEVTDHVEGKWLHDVKKGKDDGIKYFIKYKSDKESKVQATDGYHRRPLHHAANGGHVEIVKFLVEKGADLEAKDGNKRTPLHCAAGRGHAHIVSYLSEKGANFKTTDIINSSLLHSAADGGYIQIVQYLVEKGAYLETTDRYQRHPLHNATEGGHLEVVKFLVEKGANIEASGQYERKPLHIGAEAGYVKIVKYLIKKGADLESRDNTWKTPLHSAAGKGHVQVIILLVENGVNIETTDDIKVSPLHIAAREGHLEIVKYLVQKGANFEAADKNLRRPLHSTARNGHIEVVRYLVEIGADTEATDRHNRKPVHSASEMDHSEVVIYLQGNGATY